MQLPKRYTICSVQSTHLGYRNVEEDSRTQNLDYYADTGGPYILHQSELITTSRYIST
jgi:hypothetical protein